MGRKRAFDKRGRPSFGKQTWEDPPLRGRSRTRSPSPKRKRDDGPDFRRRQRSVDSVSRSPPPSRGREYAHPQRTSSGYDLSASGHTRGISRSPKPRRRRESSTPRVKEY